MKVTLSRLQVHALWVAIKAMDGRMRESKDSDGKVIGNVYQPYKFDSARPTYALAKTREHIRSEVVAIEHAQQALMSTLSSDPTPAERLAVDMQLNELMTGEVEVNVHQIPIETLNVHTNEIPPSILSDLMPMLTGEL